MSSDHKEFLQRIVVAALLISIALFFLLQPYSVITQLAFPLVLVAITLLAVDEYATFHKGVKFPKRATQLCATLFVLASFFYATDRISAYLFWLLSWLVILCAIATVVYQQKDAVILLPAVLFSILYIALPIGLIPMILFFFGSKYIIYMITVVKGYDIASYFGGKILGKNRIFKISPKKTLEGLISGIIFAIFASKYIWQYYYSTPYTYAILIGVILALLGQFGDIVESLFKRNCALKNSSPFLGESGCLDLLDSLLLTIPPFYAFIYHAIQGGFL